MKRLEFHITYICNHACIFCSEDIRMQSYNKHPLTLFQVKTILLDRRKKGFDHVNFTWGEPTLFPKFLELLEFSKKLGYRIYVGTNGTLFAWKTFAEKALQYIDELSLSVHWYDAESAYFQTKLKNHFTIFHTAVKNIVKYQKGQMFFINIVLNSHNFLFAEKIIDCICDSWYPVHQILISNIAPEGKADIDYDKLVFSLDEFAKTIPGIIENCDHRGILLRFFWLPMCILGDRYSNYSNDTHWEERHTIERFTNHEWKIILQDIYSPDNSRKRTFVEKCNGCQWREKPCTGVFTKYLDKYSF